MAAGQASYHRAKISVFFPLRNSQISEYIKDLIEQNRGYRYWSYGVGEAKDELPGVGMTGGQGCRSIENRRKNTIIFKAIVEKHKSRIQMSTFSLHFNVSLMGEERIA